MRIESSTCATARWRRTRRLRSRKGGCWMLGVGCWMVAVLLLAAAETKPAPAPEAWRKLIGEYGSDGHIVYVLERDGALTALIKPNYYTLTPAGGIKYRYSAGTLSFRFGDTGA